MEQGKCPKCQGVNLNYETIVDSTPYSQSIYYPYECDDCGFCGREYYDITFSEHCDENDVAVEEVNHG